MTTISKKEVHKFLDKHPDIPFSAAKFEYSLYLEPEAVEYANAISEKMLGNWISRRCRNDSFFDERNRTSGKNVSSRNICTRSNTCYSGTCCQIS
ncbi:MAG: hypothetical protein SO415_03295 [Oliverpabstia sp.]|nr:hypothetical protein [Oliverpabstia sp.]